MIDAYEQGPRGTSTRTLAISALVAVALVATILAATVLKARGSLTDSVPVTAELSDVGDGLPKSSDVKYRGVIVGSVRGVTPGLRGKRTVVKIALEPARAKGIPSTVTARVVPSNLFAVSSVQLLDDASGTTTRTLRGGDVITGCELRQPDDRDDLDGAGGAVIGRWCSSHDNSGVSTPTRAHASRTICAVVRGSVISSGIDVTVTPGTSAWSPSCTSQ